MFDTLQLSVSENDTSSNPFLNSSYISYPPNFFEDQFITFNSTLSGNNLGILLDEQEEEEKYKFHEKIHELSSVEKKESSDQSSTQIETINPNTISKKLLFDVIYPKKDEEEDPLFTIGENDDCFDLIFEEDEKNFIRKRYSEKRPRKENKDNILKKIKRRFINKALIKKLNAILKSIGSKLFFEKFAQCLVSNVNKENNKELLDMTLLDIFEKKELYGNDLVNYKHNIKVIKSKEVMENTTMKNILNKKYKQLFEEYTNSYEFKIGAINELKKRNMEDESIKRYIFTTKHFIEFFSQ